MKIQRRPFPHGIDLTAPGGIDVLIDFHRATFGDARMEVDGAGGDNAGDEGSGREDDRGADEGHTDPDQGAKRAIAAERSAAKQARQDLAAAQDRIKELEDAGKSEEQRREDASKALQSENSSLKSTVEQRDALLLRYDVAAAKGLDLDAAKRLQGTTREDLEADADAWIDRWGQGTPGAQQQRGQDPGQGARSGHKESAYAQGEERARARFGSRNQQ